MSACPFKVGEIVPLSGDKHGDGFGLIVWIDPIITKEHRVLAVLKNDDGTGYSSWHTIKGVPLKGENPHLIPPAPPMVRVPLGPEDVPPGSIIRSKDAAARSCHAWCAVSSVTDNALWFHADQRRIEWGDTLHDDDREISTDGGKTWQPMWKEVPATEGGAA